MSENKLNLQQTVGEAVRHGSSSLLAASREPQRDATLLLGRVLGKNRAWLLAHPDAFVTEDEQVHYKDLLARRLHYEPIQYILGEQEFYGLRFVVNPSVLIPRPETEHLVEAVLERSPRDRVVRILDVGTGSGAIAVTLACLLPLAQVAAVDISSAALEVARENAWMHGVTDRIRFLRSDLLSSVQSGRFDVVVSNPPYVSCGEQLEQQVVGWEPQAALFAGEQGMDIYKRLVPDAPSVLQGGGLLAMEIGAEQAPLLIALLRQDARWDELEFVCDLQGIERVVLAKLRDMSIQS